MLTSCPHFFLDIAREHCSRLRYEAQRARLWNDACVRSGLWYRFRSGMGDLLIGMGMLLKP